MIIGNIVTNSKINQVKYFNYYDSFESIDNELPTLVIGWELAKKLKNYDIFNKKISDKLFWTFNKFEKRSIFDVDLYEFTDYCYNSIICDVKYYFIDNLLLDKKTIYRIVRKILSSGKIISCIIEDMVYIGCDKFIFGLNKNFITYMKYDYDKLIFKIKKHSNVFLTNEEILMEYKHHIDWLDEKIRYLPHIIGKENEEKNIVSVIC